MLAEPGEAIAPTVRRRAIGGYAGARRTILVIDDDPLQLGVLQDLLRPLGFTVFAASNGVDGLDLAQRCAPDLVLLDIQMPGMSGWTVADALRLANPQSKILIVSANAHEFAAGSDGRAAHDGFIVKPVELDLLLDAIAGQLDIVWTADAGVVDAAAPAFADLSGVAPHVAELRRLGQAGHIRGVEAALKALADEVPESQPLVEALRRHVRSFDLAAYLRLLDAQS